MAVQSTVYQPTASQYASAALHLERMADWLFVRIAGERYAVIPSGTSGHTYLCRADARGCSCLGYVKTGRRCSHMLSLELAALEDDLREPAPVTIQEMRILLPGCAGGCGSLVEARDGLWCDDCAAVRERAASMAAARAKVLEAWTQEEAG